MQKNSLYMISMLVGLVVGGFGASIFWVTKSNNASYESAATRLFFHVQLLKEVQEQPPNSTRGYLVNLIEGDVLELMNLASPWRGQSAIELSKISFEQYAPIRKTLPEIINPPSYISAGERDEYMEHIKVTQQYLENK
jgi:hypothetical protein